MDDTEMRNSYVNDAVIAHLDEQSAQAVNNCPEFEDFAVTLALAAGEDPGEMGRILDDVIFELPEGQLEWVVGTTDIPPAAYLQKLIRDYGKVGCLEI
ncbi:hypothetical protein [Saccharopolyspora shandongensis]|uniref:hypothetical protein n=1 Tax=Saccharopolyspora shandongensis TaxID=418495 RepID=UPI0033C64AF6